jgi:uncharacterized phage protein gp47/JayE
MTTPGGLTTAGFQAATTTDVQTSIERDEVALIDPALNLSPTQPLGQLNGIYASAAANKWGLLAAIYAGVDPAVAVGVQLDNICAITGVTRLGATATQVLCTLNINGGQSYAPGQLVANIALYPQYTFTNVNPITTPAGAAAAPYPGILFQCTQTGPVQALAGTLTVITTAVGGWNSITNPASGTIGTNVETDTALRLRRATLLVSAGGCTIDSILAGLLNPTLVPGVLNAAVLENNGDSVDVLGTPAHSFHALIWDGAGLVASNTAIAQAILNAKPAGVRSYGQTSATATDKSGNPQTVFFTRVAQLPIYFAATVKTNAAFPSNGVALINAAIAGVFAGLQPGGDIAISPTTGLPVVTSRSTVVKLVCEAAALTVPGVTDITAFTLDTSPGPSGTVNIVPSPFQIATFSSCAVTVT